MVKMMRLDKQVEFQLKVFDTIYETVQKDGRYFDVFQLSLAIYKEIGFKQRPVRSDRVKVEK